MLFALTTIGHALHEIVFVLCGWGGGGAGGGGGQEPVTMKPLFGTKKSEARMTASVLKQDPGTYKFKGALH